MTIDTVPPPGWERTRYYAHYYTLEDCLDGKHLLPESPPRPTPWYEVGPYLSPETLAVRKKDEDRVVHFWVAVLICAQVLLGLLVASPVVAFLIFVILDQRGQGVEGNQTEAHIPSQEEACQTFRVQQVRQGGIISGCIRMPSGSYCEIETDQNGNTYSWLSPTCTTRTLDSAVGTPG